MTNTFKRNLTLNILKNSGNRFTSITFRKKDGDIRTMVVQYGAIDALVKGAKTESGRQAVATRRMNHPNLLPVFDVASRSIKSINLDTIKSIRTDNTELMIA